MKAFVYPGKSEGILPALESSHAIAEAMVQASRMNPDQNLVICLSGRGDKDAAELARLRARHSESKLAQAEHFMSAIDQRFQHLKRQGKCALLPFVTAGDPNMAMTMELLKRLDDLECGIAEVGIPYSDPIADGPVIQASYHRALQNRFSARWSVSCVRQDYVGRAMPIAGM